MLEMIFYTVVMFVHFGTQWAGVLLQLRLHLFNLRRHCCCGFSALALGLGRSGVLGGIFLAGCFAAAFNMAMRIVVLEPIGILV